MKGKMFKKTAAFILALTIISGGLPQFTGGAPLLTADITADAADSAAVLDRETGVLTLSGTIIKSDVQAFANHSGVKKVVCDEGIVLPADCSELFKDFLAAEIDLTNADTSNVTSMASMFANCKNLTTITISEKWVVNASTDTKDACKGDFKLVGGNGTTYLQNLVLEVMPLQGDAPAHQALCTYKGAPIVHFYSFDGTGNLPAEDESGNEVYVPVTGYTSNGMPDVKLKARTKKYILPECTVTLHEGYGFFNYYFNGKEYLPGDEITIEAGYNNISVQFGLEAFSSDSSAVLDETTGTLTLRGNVKKSDVQAYANFTSVKKVVCSEDIVLPADCSELFKDFLATEIDLTNADTSNVTSMESMFANCKNLTTITISEKWVVNASTNTKNACAGDFKLVGGNGTTYLQNLVLEVMPLQGDAPAHQALCTYKGVPVIHFYCYGGDAVLQATDESGKAVDVTVTGYTSDGMPEVVLNAGTKTYTLPECTMTFPNKYYRFFNYAINGNEYKQGDVIKITDGYNYVRVDYDFTQITQLWYDIDTLSDFEGTDEWKPKFNKIADDYSKMESLMQAFIINFGDYVSTAKKYYAKHPDEMTSTYVVCLIDYIVRTDYTDECKAKIDDARAAYNKLTDAQKKEVSNYDELLKAETDYAVLEDAANGGVDIQALVSDISAINTALYSDDPDLDAIGKDIAAAKKAYNSIDEKNRSYVSNYSTLERAEKFYNALKEAEEAKSALAQAKEEAAVQKKAAEEAEAAAETAKSNLEEAEKVLSNTLDSLEKVTQDLEDAKARIKELTDSSSVDEALKAEINDLREKLEAAEKAQKEAEAVKEAAEKELAELKASTHKKHFIVGDVDGSGKVDKNDAALLKSLINGITNVKIDLDASDLDRDGDVDIRDSMILTRYVNGWEDYDKYIITVDEGGTENA